MRRWILAVTVIVSEVCGVHAVDIAPLIVPRPFDTPRLAESKRILLDNPYDELALFGLAHGYHELGMYPEGVLVYERMIDIGVTRMHYVTSDRAILLDPLDRLEEAESGFRRAMDILPTFPHCYAGLATMWLRRNLRLDEAATYLSMAISYEIEPDLQNCYRAQLGGVRLRLGELDEAMSILQAAKSAIPVDLVRQTYPINEIEAIYEVRYYLAEAYARRADPVAAEREMDDVIRAFESRMAAPPKARVGIMPSGTWEMIEHPDRFRYLFDRWRLP